MNSWVPRPLSLAAGYHSSFVIRGINGRAGENFKVAALIKCANEVGDGVADRAVNGQSRQGWKNSVRQKLARIAYYYRSRGRVAGAADASYVEVAGGNAAVAVELFERLNPIDPELEIVGKRQLTDDR